MCTELTLYNYSLNKFYCLDHLLQQKYFECKTFNGKNYKELDVRKAS